MKSVVNLPTNEKVISKVYAKEKAPNVTIIHQINEMCVIICVSLYYVCHYITEQNNEGFVINHLHRTDSKSNKWHYLSKEDKCIVEADQILLCQVQGHWDIADLRNTCFTLKNVEEIQGIYHKCTL